MCHFRELPVVTQQLICFKLTILSCFLIFLCEKSLSKLWDKMILVKFNLMALVYILDLSSNEGNYAIKVSMRTKLTVNLPKYLLWIIETSWNSTECLEIGEYLTQTGIEVTIDVINSHVYLFTNQMRNFPIRKSLNPIDCQQIVIIIFIDLTGCW